MQRVLNEDAETRCKVYRERGGGDELPSAGSTTWRHQRTGLNQLVLSEYQRGTRLVLVTANPPLIGVILQIPLRSLLAIPV
jgi:hypothetical protein